MSNWAFNFRTRKSDPNVVPERNSRGAGYLFRTRKSMEESNTADQFDLDQEMNRFSITCFMLYIYYRHPHYEDVNNIFGVLG
jgi:hypothetical protein